MKSSLPIFLFLFLFSSLKSFGQSFGVVLDSLNAAPGTQICIPVKAKGFNQIVGYQYSLHWDPTVLQFNYTQHFDLPTIDLNFNLINSSTLLTVWNDPVLQGVTKNDGDTIYEVCYTVIGQPGDYSNIIIGSEFPPTVGPAEAHNNSWVNVWADIAQEHGFVQIVAIDSAQGGVSNTFDLAVATQTPGIRLSPNPATHYATVLMTMGQHPAGTLRVADATGKIVYEQQVKNEAQQMSMALPTYLFQSKGMYQVSLETGGKLVTRSLSVQ